MTDPPSHLVAFLAAHEIDAAFLDPGLPMHTVADAAAAIGVDSSQILKTLLFADRAGNHVVAVASGHDRLDRSILATVAGLGSLRMADAASVLRLTGYPAGGVAPLGFASDLPVVVDARAARLDLGYGGGGVPELLLRVRLTDVIRVNAARVAPLVVPAEPDRP